MVWANHHTMFHYIRRIDHLLKALLASIDTRVSLLMYVLLPLYYSMPGPAVVRWMTGRRAAAAGRPLQGARSC
jgi:uncharacterized membrane protein